MRRIFDQLSLLIYGLGAVLFTKADTPFLVAFLAAVICGCLHVYVRKETYHHILFLICLTLMIFLPDFALFFPVVLYSLMEDQQIPLALIGGALCLFQAISFGSAGVLCFLTLGCMLALLLNYHSSSYEALDQKFRQTRDDGVERNYLLKAKNQALLEKQDYEIYTATLKERNRIAREIHDNVGHLLSRSILLTGAIKAINKEDALAPSLAQLEESLNTAMTNIRESVHDLHDESVNLREALTGLTDAFTFCPLQMDYDMGYEVPKAVKYCFISIVKEALNNVMKHSNATQVQITLREHPGLYQLVIEDNGTDLPPDTKEGLGLVNMKDRIDSLKGTLLIQKERGFRIFITIPKQEEL